LKKGSGALSPGFLDTPVDAETGSGPRSLTQIINDEFIAPLHAKTYTVRQGQRLPSSVATSVILYGPPGTSKTKLSANIADALGWPLLKLDPSHLTRHGLDALHAEANRIFTMLEASEELVVLLDEFDELVRERDEVATDSSSRFLTTAMLPKLAALSERRRIVYLLATNHLERFDIAISREGRFDFILPVAPPTLKAKVEHWPDFAGRLHDLGLQVEGEGADDELAEWLTDLTYSEFDRLQMRLAAQGDKALFRETINGAHRRCTLLQTIPVSAPQEIGNGDGQARNAKSEGKALTWKKRLKEQRGKIRTWQWP
jgi:SpoVK/Ycf46/Vps4 family AAA+-type ATPase